AGLVTEMKGDSIPMGPNTVNFTMRQPWGVVARIVAFNHPLMFTASKIAAPLAAGNAIIIKPSEQAPLSSLRLAELIGDSLPPGVGRRLTGGRALCAGLVSHKEDAEVGGASSGWTRRSVMREAADTTSPVLFALSGKNPLIPWPDAGCE